MTSRHSDVPGGSGGDKTHFAVRHARWAIIASVLLVPVAIGSALILLYPEHSSVSSDAFRTEFGRPNVVNQSALGSNSPNIVNSQGNPDITHGLGPNNDLTITVTREQLQIIIGVLQDAEHRLEQHDTSQTQVKGTAASSGRNGVQPSAGADAVIQPTMRITATADIEPRVAQTHDIAPSRLSGALPLLFAFVGATSLIVVLMVYAGLILVRAGTAAGGAKVDIFGIKIDAKGTGIASIAFGAVVLIATFRPLIDAVVKISGE